MVGIVAAWAVLLAAAGISKVVRPRPAAQALRAARIPGGSLLASPPLIRLAGSAEVLVAGLVIIVGGPVPAALLSATYLLLSVVAWRMVRITPGQDCGCFGRAAEPITRWHLRVDAAGVAIGAAAVIWPQPSIVSDVLDQGLPGGIALVALTVLLAWLCYHVMTTLPALLEQRAKVAAPR